MTALWSYLDGLPLGPLALFASGYLVLLIAVLSVFKRHTPERCDRCGGEWTLTSRGNAWHVCAPSRRVFP
jgi:hypothetical protein